MSQRNRYLLHSSVLLSALAIAACSGTSEEDDFSATDTGIDADAAQGDSGDVAVDPVCGDGNVDRGEACDGDTIPGVTCADFDFESGTLGCSATCEIVTDACSDDPGATCGDGLREGDEECDGSDLGENSCADLGESFGELACTGTCVFDREACRSDEQCGDGFIDGTEECDDGNMSDDDGCAADCITEYCGDGLTQPGLGELCDSGSVFVVECPDVPGAPSGIVYCNGQCDFEEVVCPDVAVCGDGIIDVGEACDDGGTADGDGCAADCTVESTCGDGTRQTGAFTEACDGDDLGDATCGDLGFDIGELQCDDSCVVDFTDCRSIICGDGFVDGPEACDDGNRDSNDGCDRRCRIEPCEGTGDAAAYYVDDDGDGYGELDGVALYACDVPDGYADNADDCDDSTEFTYPGADEICDGADNNCNGVPDEGLDFTTVYADTDADDFGDATATLSVCAPVAGYVDNSDDCDDSSPLALPGGSEVCDGLDNDCDGGVDAVDTVVLTQPCYSGAAGTEDVGTCVGGTATCTDGAFGVCDGEVVPDVELCDELDNDCNAEVDDNVQLYDYYIDNDEDGQGDALGASVESCSNIDGRVRNNDDCNDDVGTIFTGADEVVGDEVDQDCDGGEICYADTDNDGARTDDTVASSADVSCADAGEAPATALIDCAPTDPAIHPAADEVCDGIDNDCVGGADDGLDFVAYWPDVDGDTYGSDAIGSTDACVQPANTATRGGDCNDGSALALPGGTEVCDGLDNDCDGGVDAVASVVLTRSCYSGSAGTEDVGACVGGISTCEVGVYSACAGEVLPTTEITADGIDQDCDGRELCYFDNDEDGYHAGATTNVANIACAGRRQLLASAPGGDCDDDVFEMNPGFGEICDGIDNDCVGGPDDGLTFLPYWPDVDVDTYGSDAIGSTNACAQPANTATRGGDCNDSDGNFNPMASDTVGDGIDNDCDGRELCYRDRDNDGYRPNGTNTFENMTGSATISCDDSGEGRLTDPTTDCNDNNASMNPGITEVCGSAQDDDCDGDGGCDDSECFSDGLCYGCADQDLGNAVGSGLTSGNVAGDDIDLSCGSAGQEDYTVVWEAPTTGRYDFSNQAGAAANILAINATCSTADLTCTTTANVSTLRDLTRGDRVLVTVEESSRSTAHRLTIEETEEGMCDDTVDNDGDGRTDCDDSQCATAPNCFGCADNVDSGPVTTGVQGSPVITGLIDTFDASDVDEEVCGGFGAGNGPEAITWWRAPADGTYRFSSYGNGGPNYIYAEGGTCIAPSLLGCDNGDGAGEFDLTVTAGDDVLVTLEAVNYGAGLPDTPWELQIFPVEGNCGDGIDDDGDGNTDCADNDCNSAPECDCVYTTIPVGASTFIGDTSFTFLANDLGSTICPNNNTARDQVYVWTAPSTGNFRFELTGASFNSAISILSGPSCNALEAECDEGQYSDVTASIQPFIVISAIAGEQLLVAVDGYTDGSEPDSGSYTLRITPL